MDGGRCACEGTCVLCQPSSCGCARSYVCDRCRGISDDDRDRMDNFDSVECDLSDLGSKFEKLFVRAEKRGHTPESMALLTQDIIALFEKRSKQRCNFSGCTEIVDYLDDDRYCRRHKQPKAKRTKYR